MNRPVANYPLPPVVRFAPTPREILSHFLWHKIHGGPCEAPIVINTIDVYSLSPYGLPQNVDINGYIGVRSQRYVWYFYSTETIENMRETTDGCYQVTGEERIFHDNIFIGFVRRSTFRRTDGSETNWLVEEYRLPDPPTAHRVDPAVRAMCIISLESDPNHDQNGNNGFAIRVDG